MNHLTFFLVAETPKFCSPRLSPNFNWFKLRKTFPIKFRGLIRVSLQKSHPLHPVNNRISKTLTLTKKITAHRETRSIRTKTLVILQWIPELGCILLRKHFTPLCLIKVQHSWCLALHCSSVGLASKPRQGTAAVTSANEHVGSTAKRILSSLVSWCDLLLIYCIRYLPSRQKSPIINSAIIFKWKDPNEQANSSTHGRPHELGRWNKSTIFVFSVLTFPCIP